MAQERQPFNWRGMLEETGPMIGHGLSQLFGQNKWENPYEAANPYLQQIPGAVGQQLNPYINAGQRALGPMQGQYEQLLKNPGQRLNQIGQSYEQSPGLQFAIKQALQAQGNAAARGGYAGSPQHEYDAMQTATGLANQDYGNWLQHATGLYGQGLTGEQNLYGTGANASQTMANAIAQALATQGENATAGKIAENIHHQDQGTFFDTLGNIAGSIFGLL